jgi:nondiscriminating glutamyl-tRNA synthetase
LPTKAAFIFGFDPDAARADPENAAILAADSARTVLGEFAGRARAHSGPVTPRTSKLDQRIKAATGVKGKELYHPIRIALTGAHSGPSSTRSSRSSKKAPRWASAIPSVRDRIEQFVGV